MYKIWDDLSLYPSLSLEEFETILKLQEKGRNGTITQDEINTVNALIEKDREEFNKIMTDEELNEMLLKEQKQ